MTTTATSGPELEAVREWPATTLVFVTVATGLCAIAANLLNFHNYPVARLEVALVVTVLLALAACATALHRLAQPRIGFAFSGLFVAILADLGSNSGQGVLLILFPVFALLAWFKERLLLKLTTAAFASVLLFQSIGLATANGLPAAPQNQAERLQVASSRNGNLVPIVHVVLDSYIGLDGMGAEATNFGNLRQEQEQFYLSRGFQLYPQAYSRHAKTINSLPEFLSYGKAKHATEPRDLEFTTAPALDYFIDLDRKGYRTSVLAPSFVDFCPNQPLTHCHNYNRSDLSTLTGSNLTVADRARVIGFTLLGLSAFTANLSGNADLQLAALLGTSNRHLYNRHKLLSLSGFQQLDVVSRDLSALKFGEARFFHLLLPHDPYVVDSNCKLLPEPDWLDEHGPAPYAERDAAYARQARCMTNQGMHGLLAALDKTPAGRAAIVIIQGDHGSRTVNNLPGVGNPRPDVRAMAVSHSAFFAIRVPGQPSGTIDGRFALDELIHGFAANDFAAAPRPIAGPAEVYLMDEFWRPARRMALPPIIQKFPKN